MMKLRTRAGITYNAEVNRCHPLRRPRLVWIKTSPKVGEPVLVGFAALLPGEAWTPM